MSRCTFGRTNLLIQHEIRYSLRVLFPQEIMLLLESAGFRLEGRYGEFPRRPFDQTSPASGLYLFRLFNNDLKDRQFFCRSARS